MNTVKSFWIGMGALCVAGGGAYYFAKQSINADRQARFIETEQKRRQLAQQFGGYETSHQSPSHSSNSKSSGAPREDLSGPPSQEGNVDPAPTRHAPDTEPQRIREKSKYEASEPYKTRKGDRFS